jgi:hypothetical protein
LVDAGGYRVLSHSVPRAYCRVEAVVSWLAVSPDEVGIAHGLPQSRNGRFPDSLHRHRIRLAVNVARYRDLCDLSLPAVHVLCRQQEVCRKARVEGNKKYINRSDVKITEEYKEQLRLRIEELMEWGENLPKKTAEVATAAGISIPGVNAPVASVQAETKSADTENQEPKVSEGKAEKRSENTEKRTEKEEKRAETTENRTETAEEPKKATETPRKKVDPTESVTEGQMKGGAL